MSWSIILQKFNQQEPSPFDKDQFEQIIAPYAELQQGEFGFELTSKMGDAFEYASIMGEEEVFFSGIMFNRPTSEGPLFNLIFDLLAVPGVCIFDPNMEFIMGRNIKETDIPEDMLELSPDGLRIINSPEEIIQHL